MVVEAVSDSTRAELLRDTEEKKLDYALAGVKEYYILDPGREHMRFYRLIAGGRYQEIEPNAEGVVASELLPGLQFRMQDLRRQRDLLELALDDVYSGYVIPDHKIAVNRAETAEQRADAEAAARRAEAQRADAAEQRTEEEAQRADAEAQRADAAEQRTEEQAQRADAEAAARQAAEQRMEEEAAARQAEAQRADEKIRAMADELDRPAPAIAPRQGNVIQWVRHATLLNRI